MLESLQNQKVVDIWVVINILFIFIYIRTYHIWNINKK